MAAIYGASKDEFVTSMAALILFDGEAEITSDNIKALLDGSNNTVAPYWPGLFASLLKDGKINTLINSLGSAGPAPAGVAVAAVAGGDAPAKEEEKKPKVEEVDALDGGMDMFGGSGGGGDY